MTKEQHKRFEIEAAKKLEDDNLVYLWTSTTNKKDKYETHKWRATLQQVSSKNK